MVETIVTNINGVSADIDALVKGNETVAQDINNVVQYVTELERNVVLLDGYVKQLKTYLKEKLNVEDCNG